MHRRLRNELARAAPGKRPPLAVFDLAPPYAGEGAAEAEGGEGVGGEGAGAGGGRAASCSGCSTSPIR